MPYTPLGQFDSEFNIQRKHDFKRPVTFYDRVRFLGGDSSIEILGGALQGDLFSSDWDGTFDLSGGAVSATAGWLLDWDSGAAQFQSIYAEGGVLGSLTVDGELLLSGLSGKISTASTAPKITIDSDSNYNSIMFYTGDAEESLQGFINTSASDGPRLSVLSPEGDMGAAYGLAGSVLMGASAANDRGYLSLFANADGTGEARITSLATADGSGDAFTYMENVAWGNGDATLYLNADVFGTGTATVDVQIDGTSIASFLSGEVQIHAGATYFDYAGNQAIAKTGSGILYIDNRNTAGDIYLRADDSGGTLRTRILIDGDGALFFYDNGGTERLRIGQGFLRSGSNGAQSAPAYSFQNDPDTGMFIASGNNLRFSSGNQTGLQLDKVSTNVEVRAPSVYSMTTGSAADVQVTSTGLLRRSTSLRRYKKRIKYNDPLADIQLKPVSYKWRKTDHTVFGFIAEDVAEAHPSLGIYDFGDDGKSGTGELIDIDLRGIVAVLAAKVNRLEKALTELP